MRSIPAFPAFALPFALVLAACVPSGPYTVVSTPAPEPAPAPAPPPPRIVPVEVSVVRSEAGRLLVQTNRSTYVALFEIVPGQGVALLYPGSRHQTTGRLSGLSWVPVWWTMRTPSEGRRYANVRGTTDRYVYAIASDRPLRITEGAYDPAYLRRVLGPTAYEATNPNATVRALSRWFVPAMPDERWGEDLYAVPASYSRESRVARVYCPDGSVFEVREEMANRVWCPPSRRGGGRVADAGGRVPPRDGTGQLPTEPLATAPDSVLGAGGIRVTRRAFDPGATTPIFRVPAEAQNRDPGQTDTNGRATGGQNHDNDGHRGQTDTNGRTTGQNHDDNGRRAHGDPANADPRGRGVGRGNGGEREMPVDVTQQAKPRPDDPNGNPGQIESGKPVQRKPAEASPATPRVDSSGKTPEKARPGAEAKDQPAADQKSKVLEAMRRSGMIKSPKLAPKPDSTSTTPPDKKP